MNALWLSACGASAGWRCDKGKPAARRGRKATGLDLSRGGRAAEQGRRKMRPLGGSPPRSFEFEVLDGNDVPHSWVGREVGVKSVTASGRSEEHTSELQSRQYLVCRLLLEKKKK